MPRPSIAALAVLAAALAPPVVAQTVPLIMPNYTNAAGQPRGADVTFDPSNAPFSVSVGPLAAATDYTASGFRSVNVTCTSAGSTTFTLIGGGTVPISLAAGASYQLGFAVASIASIPSGCTFHGLR